MSMSPRLHVVLSGLAAAALSLAGLVATSTPAAAAAGGLDTTFTPPTDLNGNIDNVVEEQSGKIIIIGSFTDLAGDPDRDRIARLNRDGSLDTSYQPTPVSNTVTDSGLTADSKMIIVGFFRDFGGDPATDYIGRLNTDGSRDSSFTPATIDGVVQTVAIQPDGKIVIGGQFASVGGVARNRIARLNPNGTLDTTFVPVTLNDTAYDVTYAASGKILVTGRFVNVGGDSSIDYITRLNANGSLDTSLQPPTFAAPAGSTTPTLYGTMAQSDGKIMVWGEFNNVGGNAATDNIARLSSTGARDATLTPAVINAGVFGLFQQQDGKYVVSGGFTNAGGNASTDYTARLGLNGTLDSSFVPPVLNNPAWSNFQTSEGKYLVGGNFTNVSGRSYIVQLFGDGLFASPDPLDFGTQTNATTSTTQMITVSNSGTATYSIPAGGVTKSGTDQNLFSVVSDAYSGATLAPGAQCTVGLTFTPASDGSKTAQVSIASDAPNSPAIADVSGTGTSIGLVATPNPVNFGDIAVNNSSPAQLVTIYNDGSDNIVFDAGGLQLTGTDQTLFSISNDTCSGQTLLPTNSCTAEITFTPSSLGAKYGQLQLSDNRPSSPQTVVLNGTGAGIGFEASPVTIDFGEQLLNQTVTEVIMVSNPGTGDLIFGPDAVVLNGDTGHFAIESETCSNSSLSDTDQCQVEVSFTPTTIGAKSATVDFTNNGEGSPQSVSLAGAGTTVGFVADPDPVDFGAVAIGDTGSHALTITNNGTTDLLITSIQPMGTDAGDFSVGTEDCTSWPVGAGLECSVQVNYTPTVVGASSATLSFTSNGPNSPQEIDLQASAINPGFSPNSSALAFPGQPITTSSAPETVVITNDGTTPLQFGAGPITLTGTSAAMFSISNDLCSSQVIDVGNTCSVEVSFTPTTTGIHTATATFDTNTAGAHPALALSGTGLAAQVDPSVTLVDFGDWAVNATSTPVDITFTNSGDTDLIVPSASTSITGDDSASFEITDDACSGATLAIAANCQVTLTFRPAIEGPKSATLQLASNAPTSPTAITLSGQGIGTGGGNGGGDNGNGGGGDGGGGSHGGDNHADSGAHSGIWLHFVDAPLQAYSGQRVRFYFEITDDSLRTRSGSAQPDLRSLVAGNGVTTLKVGGRTICTAVMTSGTGSCQSVLSGKGTVKLVATFNGTVSGTAGSADVAAVAQTQIDLGSSVAITAATLTSWGGGGSAACRLRSLQLAGLSKSGGSVTIMVKSGGAWVEAGTAHVNGRGRWKARVSVASDNVHVAAKDATSKGKPITLRAATKTVRGC